MTTPIYKAPKTPPEAITPSFVRDELLECFESANREFSQLLNQPVNNRVLKDQVRRFVITVFVDCSVSYRNPTKKGILEAIGRCKANAEEMMGSQGRRIIKHHYKEIMKLVNRLSD